MSQIPVHRSHELSAPAGPPPSAPPSSAASPAVVSPALAAAQEAPAEQIFFNPLIDIYDSPEGLVLIADLPGVKLDTLELQVQDNRLTLLGHVAPTAPPGARLIHKEYAEGDFLRSFILSDEVDHERIQARLNNGVLEVILPKAAKGPPRRIQVKSD
jgi:HSP20 family molecular chaperone IbpA